MQALTTPPIDTPTSNDDLQKLFLAVVLPRLQTHAAVCLRDVRCVMMNLDPDTAVSDGRLLKAAVRINENCAGVYATTIRTGPVRVGDALYLAST